MTFDIVAYPLSLIYQCREEAEKGDVSDEFSERVYDEFPSFSDHVGDSASMFYMVCSALEGADALEFHGKTEFLEFFNSFISHSPDSDVDVSSLAVLNNLAMAVINPERVDRLTTLIPKISVAAWNAEYRKQPQAAENVKSGFLDDEINSYLNKLSEFVAEVSGKGDCLAVLLY